MLRIRASELGEFGAVLLGVAPACWWKALDPGVICLPCALRSMFMRAAGRLASRLELQHGVWLVSAGWRTGRLGQFSRLAYVLLVLPPLAPKLEDL